MLKPIGVGLLCFIIFLFLHVYIFHYRKIKERWKLLYRIFYLMAIVYPLLYWLTPPDPLLSMIPASLTTAYVYRLLSVLGFFSGLILYAFLFIGYLEFYFTADRSITIRIMMELEKATGKKMTFERIKKAYNPDMILKRRFDELVGGGYLNEHNGYYSNTKKGRLVAKLYKFVIEFLNLTGG